MLILWCNDNFSDNLWCNSVNDETRTTKRKRILLRTPLKDCTIHCLCLMQVKLQYVIWEKSDIFLKFELNQNIYIHRFYKLYCYLFLIVKKIIEISRHITSWIKSVLRTTNIFTFNVMTIYILFKQLCLLIKLLKLSSKR